LIEFQIPNDIQQIEPDLESYLLRMSRDGEWGDHTMLQVLANVLRRNIHVIRPDKDIHVDALQPILLGHIPEFHYYSLEPGKKMGVNGL